MPSARIAHPDDLRGGSNVQMKIFIMERMATWAADL